MGNGGLVHNRTERHRAKNVPHSPSARHRLLHAIPISITFRDSIFENMAAWHHDLAGWRMVFWHEILLFFVC
jgi:hypothetical protein